MSALEPLRWKDSTLHVLNQLKLPLVTEYQPKRSTEEVFHAIRDMELRGAPLIGMAAAYGMCLGLRDVPEMSHDEFMKLVKKNAEFLATARPTAVNLAWVLDRMIKKVEGLENHSVASKKEALEQEAIEIHREDARICRAIGENFMPLFRNGMTLLTHCNAGSLATAQYGTATSPMYIAKERGWDLTVYADETRPYLQGARLTTYELQQAGIRVILICDSAAGVVMSQGKVDAVITGADRVAANGDIANKVGTASLAVLANYYGIPFYVAVPTPTIDLNTPSGAEIPIEERNPREVTHWKDCQIAPHGVSVFNPAFDVTPHGLVTAIVTEKGVVSPPFLENLRAHLGENELKKHGPE